MEVGTSGLAARNSDHWIIEAVSNNATCGRMCISMERDGRNYRIRGKHREVKGVQK
jgi:hypothetical protein